MNVCVQNKKSLYFQITDCNVEIKEYKEVESVIYYNIKVSVGQQVWSILRRYNQFDQLHNRLLEDCDSHTVANLPSLPPKRYFYCKEKVFLDERHKSLDAYIKSLIEIHEIIENPIFQKFLEIDINYDPASEYRPIEAQEYQNDPQFHVPLPKNRIGKPLIPLLPIPDKKSVQ